MVTVDTTPIRRASFLTAVAVAAGRSSPEIRYEEEREEIRGKKAPTVKAAENILNAKPRVQ